MPIPVAHRASILWTTLKSCSSISQELYSCGRSGRVSVFVVGCYDPSVTPEAYTEDSGSLIDFIVRGKGKSTFHELLCTVEMEKSL
jgi:hypothetical protein